MSYRSEPHPLISGGSSGSSAYRHRTNSIPEVVLIDQLPVAGEEDHHHLDNHHHLHDYHHRHDNHHYDHRRHDYSSSAASTAEFLHGQGLRRKGKSWKDILKLKRKRAKLRSPPQIVDKVATETDVYHPRIGGYCIRVVVTEINPQAYYKTLEVTDRTTAFEVIVKLIQKYAVREEDRDPNEFYLMEVKEGSQGSYSRVLANTDQLYELQCKWAEEEDCYFALYRAELPPTQEPEVEDKFEQPDISNFKAVIISPSQDSFFDSFPDPRDTSLFPSFSPMPLPTTSTPSLATPTTQALPSYRDLSSRVQVSKLIVSPSESNNDLGAEKVTDRKNNPTFSYSPAKSTSAYSTFSDSKIDTIAESEAENDPISRSEPAKLSDSSHLRYTQRRAMQKSLSMGMQGIMAKVVSENSPIRKKAHERSQSSPSQLLAVRAFRTPPSPTSPEQDLMIRNLACSPLAPAQVSRGKNIPDFVFTPGPDDGTSDSSEADFQGSENSEPIKSGGSLEKSFNFVGVLDFDSSLDSPKSEDDNQGQWGELARSDREKRSLTDEQRSDVIGGLLDIAEEEDENGDDDNKRHWYEEDEKEEVMMLGAGSAKAMREELGRNVRNGIEEWSRNEGECKNIHSRTREVDFSRKGEKDCIVGSGEYSKWTENGRCEDRKDRRNLQDVAGGEIKVSDDRSSEEFKFNDEVSEEDVSTDGNRGKDSVSDDEASGEEAISDDKEGKDNRSKVSWDNADDARGGKEPIQSNVYRNIEKCENLMTNIPHKPLPPSELPAELEETTTIVNAHLNIKNPSSYSPPVKAKGSQKGKKDIQLKHFSALEYVPDIVLTNQSLQLQAAQSEPDFATVDDKRSRDKVSSSTQSEHKSTASVEKMKPSVPVSIPLRRAHTSQGLFSSVTRVNRPHSIHFSSTPSNVAVDYTKDEIFRKAALKGMFKKPTSKEPPSSGSGVPSSGEKKDKTVSFPVKEIVTDLDSVAIGEKKHHKISRRNSLFDIKSSAGDQQYVRIRDKMAMLDGSPPRPLRPRQSERPRSVHFGDGEQGSLRPYSAPAKFKKSEDTGSN